MTENTGKRTDYAQIIEEITQELQATAADALKAVMQSGLRRVICAIGAESGSVWLYEKEKDGRIYPSFWISDADLTGLSLSLGEGVAGTVVQIGQPLVVNDCRNDERWAGRFDQKTGFETKSMVCVPMIDEQEVIGCIQIINKKDGSLYCDEDVHLCENLAVLIAEVLRKNLHEKVT